VSVLLQLVLVGCGGFVGAVARYGLGGAAHRLLGAGFPFGTLAVNVLGCFVIGGLIALAETRQVLGPGARLFFLMGVLGSFTTFSAFGHETLEYLRAGELRLATLNAAANLVAGVGAVALGRIAGKVIAA